LTSAELQIRIDPRQPSTVANLTLSLAKPFADFDPAFNQELGVSTVNGMLLVDLLGQFFQAGANGADLSGRFIRRCVTHRLAPVRRHAVANPEVHLGQLAAVELEPSLAKPLRIA
jgi:hypothetical protein